METKDKGQNVHRIQQWNTGQLDGTVSDLSDTEESDSDTDVEYWADGGNTQESREVQICTKIEPLKSSDVSSHRDTEVQHTNAGHLTSTDTDSQRFTELTSTNRGSQRYTELQSSSNIEPLKSGDESSQRNTEAKHTNVGHLRSIDRGSQRNTEVQGSTNKEYLGSTDGSSHTCTEGLGLKLKIKKTALPKKNTHQHHSNVGHLTSTNRGSPKNTDVQGSINIDYLNSTDENNRRSTGVKNSTHDRVSGEFVDDDADDDFKDLEEDVDYMHDEGDLDDSDLDEGDADEDVEEQNVELAKGIDEYTNRKIKEQLASCSEEDGNRRVVSKFLEGEDVQEDDSYVNRDTQKYKSYAHGGPCAVQEDSSSSSSRNELFKQNAEQIVSDSDQTEELQIDDGDSRGFVDETSGDVEQDIASHGRKDTGRSINAICGNLLQKAQSMSEGLTDGGSCDSNPVSPFCGPNSNLQGGEGTSRTNLEKGDSVEKEIHSGVELNEPLDIAEFSTGNLPEKPPLLYTRDEIDFSADGSRVKKRVRKRQKLGVHGVGALVEDRSEDKKAQYLCPVCGKTFNSKLEVSRHKSEAHSKPGMFRCDKCDLSFSRRAWKAHLKEVHAGPVIEGQSAADNIVWIYPIMHPKPSDDRKYAIGVDITGPNPILECCFCSRKFHISGLHAHFLHVHPAWKLQYLCSSCGIQFAAIRTLARHVRKFPTCSDARCKSCDKSFVPVTAMLDHKCEHLNPEHEEQRALQCRKCGRSYKQRFHLLLHSARCKKNKILKNECCICSRCFGTLKGLQKHLKSHTSQEEKVVAIRKKTKVYKCNMCEMTFGDRLEKNRHRTQMHRDHVCPVCNEAFETKSKLGRHLVSHRTEKNYTCPLCDTPNRYRSEFCVRKHVRRCHQDQFKALYGWDITIKRFICDICDKGCLTRGDLAKHIRCHTNERPYHCKHCSSAFKQNRHLKEHMMYRHKEIYEESFGPIEYKHKCDQCERKFLQSCTLQKHLRAHARQKMLESLKTQDGGTAVAESIQRSLKPKRSRKKVQQQPVPTDIDLPDAGDGTATKAKPRPKRRKKKDDIPQALDLSVGGSIRPLAGVFVNHSLFPPDYDAASMFNSTAGPSQWPMFPDGFPPELRLGESRMMNGVCVPQGSSSGKDGVDDITRYNSMIPPINGLVLAGQDEGKPVSVSRVSFSSMSTLPVVDAKTKTKTKRKSSAKPRRSRQMEEDHESDLDNMYNQSLTGGSVNGSKLSSQYPEILKIKSEPEDYSDVDDGFNNKVIHTQDKSDQSFSLDDSFSSDDKPDPSKRYMEMLEKGFNSNQFPDDNKYDTDAVPVIKTEPEDQF